MKKAVILLCPGDDQSASSRGVVGPGRAVRVQFSSPTSTASAAVDTADEQPRSSTFGSDRYRGQGCIFHDFESGGECRYSLNTI